MFVEGQHVVKVIEIMGSRTATIANRVTAVRCGAVHIEGSDHVFDAHTGNELDPAIPGCRSYLVPLDDGEDSKLKVSNKTRIEMEIRGAIGKAVAAEREACAKIAETASEESMCRRVAESIRARGSK